MLFEVSARCKTDGVAVLFVSHRLDELYEICDRVTIMRDGRTVTPRRWPTMPLDLVRPCWGANWPQLLQAIARDQQRRRAPARAKRQNLAAGRGPRRQLRGRLG